jgi:hypothetical protein
LTGIIEAQSDTSHHELTGANGGEIEIRERSDLDRARYIAYRRWSCEPGTD